MALAHHFNVPYGAKGDVMEPIRLSRKNERIPVEIDGTTYEVTPRLSMTPREQEEIQDYLAASAELDARGRIGESARKIVEAMVRVTSVPRDVMEDLPTGVVLELFRVFNTLDPESEKKTTRKS